MKVEICECGHREDDHDYNMVCGIRECSCKDFVLAGGEE
jgi:hypothetical protein